MKYLKNGGLVLVVTDCYAYRYDYGKGKTVLRIKVKETDSSFAEIQSFFANVSDYEYYEGEDNEGILKTVYEQYGADLDIHYRRPADTVQPNGSVVSEDAYYDIEVLRDPSLDASVRMLQKENEALRVEVAALQETNSSLEAEITSAQIALVDLYETMIVAEVG